MVLDTIMGVVDAVSLVVSLGSSSAVTPAVTATVKTGVTKLGIDTIKKAAQSATKSLTGQFAKKIMDKAKSMAIEKSKDILVNHVQTQLVSNFCQTIYDGMIAKSKPSFLTEEKLIAAVDIFSIKGMIDGCKDVKTPNKQIECAKAVITSASTFDPTGILGIAATFMHPACPAIQTAAQIEGAVDADSEVLADLVRIGFSSLDEKFAHDIINNKTITHNKTDCIIFFDKANFKGSHHIVCDQTNDPKLPQGTLGFQGSIIFRY